MFHNVDKIIAERKETFVNAMLYGSVFVKRTRLIILVKQAKLSVKYSKKSDITIF